MPITTEQRNLIIDATDHVRNCVGFLETLQNGTELHTHTIQQINDARAALLGLLDELVEAGDLEEGQKDEILVKSNAANDSYAAVMQKGIEISQATLIPVSTLVSQLKAGFPPDDPILRNLVEDYIAISDDLFINKINGLTGYVNQFWQDDAALPVVQNDSSEDEQQLEVPHHTESSSSNED